jgi:hypothetical protein
VCQQLLTLARLLWRIVTGLFPTIHASAVNVTCIGYLAHRMLAAATVVIFARIHSTISAVSSGCVFSFVSCVFS